MFTVTDLETIRHQKNSIVTIGTFDGVHLGHRQIIKKVVEESKQFGSRSVLLTFDPHPQAVIHPERSAEMKVLTSIGEKKKLLEALGIDTLIVAKFDKHLAQKTGEEFVKEILMDRIGLQKCIVGHDHVFGKNRSGDFELLRAMGKSGGFEVERIEAFELNHTVVNSTHIRKFIQDGNMESANQFLGRAYALKGKIVKGDGRGSQIGYPTANLVLNDPQKLVPKNGVYAATAVLNGTKYQSVTNIGTNPTFRDAGKTSIEVHILNFNSDLYDMELELSILYRIRAEKKFNSIGELTAEIQNDIDFAVKKGFSMT